MNEWETDDDNTPDEVLVVAAILGDLKAFNELVKRYAQAVLRVARNVTGRGSAEDIAQESWLLAFKALPSIEHPERFAAWLKVITRNRALRYREQENTRKARHVAFDSFLIEQLSALQKPVQRQREEEEFVKDALDRLPEDISVVFRMRYYDEMPLKRIGAFLGVPESTIKWRIHRGKQLLREQFNSHR